jgi:SpoVK/Ycf46/Vps4 family AAA+-type ATPase
MILSEDLLFGLFFIELSSKSLQINMSNNNNNNISTTTTSSNDVKSPTDNINKSSSSEEKEEKKVAPASAREALAELGIFVNDNDELLEGLHQGGAEEKSAAKLFESKLNEEDVYTQLKTLQRQLEFVNIQSEYIRDEQKNLKRELLRARDEIKRIQSVPLVIGQFLEVIDQNTGIVSSTTGHIYYVRILSTINRELLKPNSSVALHRYSNSVVDVLPPEADSAITMMQMQEKPDVTYADIGGMDIQKQEIREAVELPLTHFELYRQIGIDPPRGVLLWGPPVGLNYSKQP